MTERKILFDLGLVYPAFKPLQVGVVTAVVSHSQYSDDLTVRTLRGTEYTVNSLHARDFRELTETHERKALKFRNIVTQLEAL